MLLVNNFNGRNWHCFQKCDRKWEVLAYRLTDNCPKFCGLADRLPSRSANVFETQHFWFSIDTTNTLHKQRCFDVFMQLELCLDFNWCGRRHLLKVGRGTLLSHGTCTVALASEAGVHAIHHTNLNTEFSISGHKTDCLGGRCLNQASLYELTS